MHPDVEEEELIESVGRFTDDPLGYVLFAYPWGQGELRGHDGPDDWQTEVLGWVRDGVVSPGEAIQIAVTAGHGPGKSALGAWLIEWGMATCVDCQGVVTATTKTQLTTKTWKELSKWHRLNINSHWFKLESTSYHSVDPAHSKTWRFDIIPWSKEKPEAFAGLHNEGKRIIIIFDEASGIDDVIWETTEGALTDENTEIIWCCFGNPIRNSGRFRECFRRYAHRWNTMQVDSRDAKVTNKLQIQKLIDDHGEESDHVKVRVRGIFPSMSAKQFISQADVDAARGRHLDDTQYSWAPIIICVDPAWEGDDEFVIGMRQGLKFDILSTFMKNDNDVYCATLIAEFEDRYDADAVFIDAGYGTGIKSIGDTWERTWQLVWFGGKSSDPGCLNKRTQIWNETRKWLKMGGAIPDDETLCNDLISPETIPRLDGKKQLEKKSDLKERLGFSPGRGDCLAVSFAYPVASKRHQPKKNRKKTSRRDYDPRKARKR